MKLSKKSLLVVSVMLFALFFGAGNLIFPPFLGAQAGTHTWQAFAGFAVSAVFLPILGVAAVTKSGGLSRGLTGWKSWAGRWGRALPWCLPC